LAARGCLVFELAIGALAKDPLHLNEQTSASLGL
jgi:hypothetical protein